MKKIAQKDKPSKESCANWKQFWAFFKHAHLSWGWIILSILLNIVYYLTVTKLPGSTAALFMGKFTTKAIMGVVVNYSCTLVMLVLVSLGSLMAESKSVRSVRNAVWTRMMGIQANYYDEHSANHLLSAVTSDTQAAVVSLMQLLVTVPGMLMYLSRALPQINSFSPKLLWAVLVLIPFYIIYALFMGRWQLKVGKRIQMKIGGLTGYLTDRIRNLTMIKSFVTEEQEEEKGVAAAKELYKSNIEYAHLNSVIVAYTILAEVIGIVIAVIWGCSLLRNNEIDLESWLAFYLFVPPINTMFRQLTNLWANLKDVQGRAAQLGAMMEAPQENMNTQSAKDFPLGDIQLENIQFSYRENVTVLDHISFTIPSGKVTAIVGLSGSGKTTILRLIEKLYTPQNGKITIAGQPLEQLNLQAWRKRLSYVNQGAALFSGTIREALTYGVNRTVEDSELDRVTKFAGIYDFISSKPKRYDEELAIWGNAMSGGQRQRMVIARELLKNADVLLLDEPTSALDAETASAVIETFFSGFDGKTIVAVTHELGFISHADQIVVLHEGQIAGIGKHEKLMASCPAYCKLVEEQSYQEVFAK